MFPKQEEYISYFYAVVELFFFCLDGSLILLISQLVYENCLRMEMRLEVCKVV